MVFKEMTPADIVRERNHSKLRADLEDILDSISGDGRVEDVFVNSDGGIWLNMRGVGAMPLPSSYSPDKIRSIICSVASLEEGRICNAEHPVLEAILPFDGARFTGLLPPVVRAPSFAVRPRPRSIYTLTEYLKAGVLTGKQTCLLQDAIQDHKNILIVGSTGAGKTTLLNACIAHIDHIDRVITIEDTYELQCSAPNQEALHATASFSMRRCLRTALRLCPTRIIVGEVRGAEALDLLKAWNTGHPGGLATVHADGCLKGLLRLEALAREATRAPQQHYIASTIDLVVHIGKDSTVEAGRRVLGVARVLGYRAGAYELEDL